MSDKKNENVTVKIIVDGECVHESDTHGVLVIDDNGSYSMNIDGLVGAIFMICEVSNHFSKAIVDIDYGAPFDIAKARFFEQLKARMMLTAMCSSMASFGETHDLKEFQDAANELHDKAIELLDKINDIETKDAES